MSFRANEAAINGYEKLKNYLIQRDFSPIDRSKGEETIQRIVDLCGPVVERYPTWHPLVMNHDRRFPETHPSDQCGYRGLDHTRYFAHGFITCPYTDGQDVIDSVQSMPTHHAAAITAERLDASLYSKSATPVLVRCEWSEPLETGGLVPQRLAVPLMLEREVPCWKWSERAETWETMRTYLLGEPHGKRSSLFLSQESALAMKKVYVAMTDSGMFGPYI